MPVLRPKLLEDGKKDARSSEQLFEVSQQQLNSLGKPSFKGMWRGWSFFRANIYLQLAGCLLRSFIKVLCAANASK